MIAYTSKIQKKKDFFSFFQILLLFFAIQLFFSLLFFDWLNTHKHHPFRNINKLYLNSYIIMWIYLWLVRNIENIFCFSKINNNNNNKNKLNIEKKSKRIIIIIIMRLFLFISSLTKIYHLHSYTHTHTLTHVHLNTHTYVQANWD